MSDQIQSATTTLRSAAAHLRYQVARTEPHPGAEIPDCPRCPDGHRAFGSRPWGAFVKPHEGAERPQSIIVCRSAGEHVSEAEAHEVWRLLEIGMRPEVALFAAEWLDQSADWRTDNPGDVDEYPDLGQVNDPALVFARAYLSSQGGRA